MRKLVLSIAALAVTLAAVPAAASASQPCGAVNVVPIAWKVWVSKRGPVTCHRARAITVYIYEGRGYGTPHCVRGHPNCWRNGPYGYTTKRGLPGWRYLTGAGGGAAWRGRSRVAFEWGS